MDNSTLGVVSGLQHVLDIHPKPADPQAFRSGEAIADAVGVIQGIAEIGVGSGIGLDAVAGGIACVALTTVGCAIVVVPGVLTAVAAGETVAAHGAAMLVKIGKGSQHANASGAGNPKKLALGRREIVKDFAKANGADHLMDGTRFAEEFFRRMNDKGTKVLFNKDGVDVKGSMERWKLHPDMWSGVDWELYQVGKKEEPRVVG